MKVLLHGSRKLIDFLICLSLFPDIIKYKRLLTADGLTTVAEKVFLYIISKHIPVEGDILEIGSCAGASGLVLATGNELSTNRGGVWLLEPRPNPSKEAFIANFEKSGFYRNVHLIDKTSEDAKKELDKRFRFIFIDGDHSYEYVKKDISLWQDSLNSGGIMAFHDYTLEGVSKAIYEMIKKSDKFEIAGTIGGILYAVKGVTCRNNLFTSLKKLDHIRKRLIRFGEKLRFVK